MKKDLLNQTQEIEFIIFNASQIKHYFPEPRRCPHSVNVFSLSSNYFLDFLKGYPPAFLTESITV